MIASSMDMSTRPAQLGADAVSVVVCAYTEQRWGPLVEAVESIQAQTPPAGEIVVVIDHNPGLLALARERLVGVMVLANDGPRGLSGARNTGVAVAQGEIIAFLDDDAQAQPGWLAALVGPFADPTVIGTGGVVSPRWESGKPAWIPAEFLWVVGCSYRGLPTVRTAIRNPIGTNMAFRRVALLRAGGFADGIGRVGRTPLGCEETELSIRARNVTGGTIMHIPDCLVSHRVTADRTSWQYYRRRCWAEGLSKALVGSSVGTDAALATERDYALRTLPTGVSRGITSALRGEPAGLARGAAIVAGLAITTAGYVWGRVMGRRQTRGRT
jgi:glycosyltransferase involved in cell wall biosynthesis